jgi:hypothetical protein
MFSWTYSNGSNDRPNDELYVFSTAEDDRKRFEAIVTREEVWLVDQNYSEERSGSLMSNYSRAITLLNYDEPVERSLDA